MSNKKILISEVNQILMQFGQNIGLPDLILDENVAASLVFDDQFLVEIQALDREGNNINTLYLLSVLSPAPQHKNKDDVASFNQKLLEANLSGSIMSGVAFTIDSDNGDILLMSSIPSAMLTVENLETQMEIFVNVLEHWSTILKNGVLDFSEDQGSAKLEAKTQEGLNVDSAVRI